MVSDGGGLPFPPAALDGAPGPLDPEDPAVGALLAHLAAGAAPKRSSGAPWKRSSVPASPPVSLDRWRLLARTDDEALFGRGQPPQLLTIAVHRNPRRGNWVYDVSSAARPLRATRDGSAHRPGAWTPRTSRQPTTPSCVFSSPSRRSRAASGRIVAC
jgi:hypothetical protein